MGIYKDVAEERERERENADHAISVMGMPVRPTLDIIPLGHNTSGA